MFKLSLFEKIEDWFLDHKAVEGQWLEDYYFSWCRIWRKFINLYYYGPKNFIFGVWALKSYLWNHHWFDYYYLLDLLRIKLRYDAKHYRKYGISVNSSKYASQMDQCSDIIDRIIKDDYDTKFIDDVEKKLNIKYNFSISKNNFIKDFYKKSKEEKAFIRSEMRKAYQEGNKLRQADTKKLFKIMSDNIWSWWD